MMGLVKLVARRGYEDLVGSVQAVRASDTDWELATRCDTPLSHDNRWLYPPRQPGERPLNGILFL